MEGTWERYCCSRNIEIMNNVISNLSMPVWVGASYVQDS